MTPASADMAANGRTAEEVCELIGADSLQYLSLGTLKQLARGEGRGFCDACFTGDYVLPVREDPNPQLSIFPTIY